MGTSSIPASDLAKSLVRVGDGRGFVVKGKNGFHDRLVITAAHCLPEVPAPSVIRGEWAETFRGLLGPINGAATVWAECLFAEPIADVAVLGSPDNQAMSEEADAYGALVGSIRPLRIADVTAFNTPAPGRLVALDGHLTDCTVRHFGGDLLIENATEGIMGGMSGSPVLDSVGAAIGIVSQSGGTQERHTEGLAPRLALGLPGWVLIEIGAVGLLTAAHRALRTHWRQMQQHVRCGSPEGITIVDDVILERV